MQKVSKQSLAMIALSILLAISIALTFTFAALTNEKTATGTITFAGQYSITMTGVKDTSLTDAWEFEGTIDTNGKIALTNNPTVTFTNISAKAKMKYGVQIATEGNSAGAISGEFGSDNGTIKESNEASVSVALSSLLTNNASVDWSKVEQTTDGYTALKFSVKFVVDTGASTPSFN